ncbi:PIN domain-like protein [Protomyces lactucae-debilis]|uniref:PIN domain-like protein n=1 Tax=Protomyces lactucae-debilis TaxID=2754530 RepID=A0A1Y2F9G2_PROLT|nr:PIN domain-like protein [Protomyces lactucae-debilis]ORY79535.1 PIN domain-like protein [Protomyces lactucae-debilis]
MGISGLLPALKSITQDAHLRNYAGHTLGVDAYVWLHRGAFSCAWDLSNGIPTAKFVDYAMHRVKMLQHFGVTPYLVFDGGYLPSKAHTEMSRAKRREENMAAGKAFQAKGNRKAAQDCYTKAIDVTPAMALQLILALQKAKIAYVVAPYEADAQLAYLEKQNIIHGIITEDSDLLVFGCHRVLFKLNEFGDCSEITRDRLAMNKDLPLAGWSPERFRWMAILSGCDYLVSIPGMGLKRAHACVKKHKTLSALFKALRMETGLRMPHDYEAQFRIAEETFLHQHVFCPVAKKLLMWNEPAGPLSEATLAHIGECLPDHVAQQIATGLLDPITKEAIDLVDIMPAKAKMSSAAAGTRNIKSFLVPQPLKSTAPLADVSLNVVAARRPAPLTLRETQRAKKLKLFESSPSPESLKGGAGGVLQAYGIALGNGPIRPSPQPARSKIAEKENQVSPFFLRHATPATIRKNRPIKAVSPVQTESERWFDSDPEYERAMAEALDASAKEESERQKRQLEMDKEQVAAIEANSASQTEERIEAQSMVKTPEPVVTVNESVPDSPEAFNEAVNVWKADFGYQASAPISEIQMQPKVLHSRRAPFFAAPVQPSTAVSKTTAYFMAPSETRKTFGSPDHARRSINLSAFKCTR